MKKLLSCIFAATMTLCAYAQPTLTAATITPVIGQIDTFHFIDTIGITPGPSGAGVTWNFASATSTGLRRLNYTSCIASPFCDSFPGSNFTCLSMDTTDGPDYDTVYGYYTAGSNSLDLTGVYTPGLPLSFDFVKRNEQKYPMIFGDGYIDTIRWSMTAFGAYTYSATDLDSFLADAYGTLILPSATYSNVLRIKRWHINGAVNGRVESYCWYKPGYHNPLLYIDMCFDIFGVQYGINAAYYANVAAVTGITNTNSNPIDIRAYPNPAKDILNITFNIPDITDASLTLSDITGRSVKTITDLTQGSNNITISSTELSAGFYTLRLQTQNGTTTQKITIIK